MPLKRNMVRAGRVELYRKEDQLIMEVSVLPEIEALFRSDEVSESSKYRDAGGNNLMFYELKNSLGRFSETYNMQVSAGSRANLREYGSTLMKRNGFHNLSLLRTVGISKGVAFVLDEKIILDEEVEEYVEVLGMFLKFLYDNFVSNGQKKRVIDIEI